MDRSQWRRIQRAADAKVKVSIVPCTDTTTIGNYEWLLSSPFLLDESYGMARLMADLEYDLGQLAQLVSFCMRLINIGEPQEYVQAAKKILQLAPLEG